MKTENITSVDTIESIAKTSIEDDLFYVVIWYGGTAVQSKITERELNAYKFLQSQLEEMTAENEKLLATALNNLTSKP